VYLSKVALRHPVVPFTAVQLMVTAVLGLGWSAVAEGFPIPDGRTWPAIVVTGLAVSAGAFLLQVWSQTVIGPSRTAIVLALEPAFAAGTAMLVLGERLTARGWLGAALILAGIYIVLGASGDEDELPLAESLTPAH
jgi:drug/metabolite transporter (DMT)-like permease